LKVNIFAERQDLSRSLIETSRIYLRNVANKNLFYIHR